MPADLARIADGAAIRLASGELHSDGANIGWTAGDSGVYGARMIDPKILDDLAKRVAGNAPAGFQLLQEDLYKNLRSALGAGLGHLDLVTREEYEVQRAVLARTREKLDLLEKQIEALERELSNRS